MPRISHVEPGADELTLTVDGRVRRFGWFWLRDHAQDATSFHPVAGQRLVETFHLGPVDTAAVTVAPDGEALALTWPTGPAGVVFTADYLATVDDPGATYPATWPEATPWRGDELAERMVEVPFGDYLADDDALTRVLDAFARDGAATVVDVPLDRSDTRAVLERIGYVRNSIFGEIWEIRSGGGIADTASTTLTISPHTDGTYNHDAPGLIAFHSWPNADTGGETVLVDGLALARRLAVEAPTAFDTLRTVAIPGQYIGDGVHLVARRPVLRHDDDRLAQVSFNNHDRAPFVLPADEMAAVYDALAAFDAVASDPEMQYRTVIPPGRLVLVDNWRLLHARTSFTGDRLIVGGDLNREDVESRRRMLAPTPLVMTP